MKKETKKYLLIGAGALVFLWILSKAAQAKTQVLPGAQPQPQPQPLPQPDPQPQPLPQPDPQPQPLPQPAPKLSIGTIVQANYSSHTPEWIQSKILDNRGSLFKGDYLVEPTGYFDRMKYTAIWVRASDVRP
jgi:hypothetical protein